MAQQRTSIAKRRTGQGLRRIAVSPQLAQRFAQEYRKDFNATQAYLRAKPDCTNENTARANGSRLLANAHVQNLLEAGVRQDQASNELSAARVLEEMRRLAFFDPLDFFLPTGQLKRLKDIPPEARAVIAGLEVARANFDRTDGRRSNEWLHKIKLAPKVNALEMLAKHFKLLDRAAESEEGDVEKFVARINRARQRMAAERKEKK